MDAAIKDSLQSDWKTSDMKLKKVRIAIRETLVKAAAQPVAVNTVSQNTAHGDYSIEAVTDQILELAKHQNDY